MTARTILIHRGGFGAEYKLGTVEIAPEGVQFGYERYWVRLSVLGDSHRSCCSCTSESLPDVIAEYTAIALCGKTYLERQAALRKDSARRSTRKRARRQLKS